MLCTDVWKAKTILIKGEVPKSCQATSYRRLLIEERLRSVG